MNKSVITLAVLATALAGCATTETSTTTTTDRVEKEYVTGSSIPKKSRPGDASGVSVYDQEAAQRVRDSTTQLPRPGQAGSP